jgi:lysophospholipase L1-like esterase
MNWILYIVGVILLVLAAVMTINGWWRYTLTGYLIARVTPYEQSGTGTGSILVIGDSTGYGTGASQSSESIAGRLGADFPAYSITNNSVNGRKIAGAREVAAGLLENTQYDLVVLQIGANDLIAGSDPGAVAAELQQLIEQVIPHTRKIVVLTSGNIGATPVFGGEQAQQLEDASRLFDWHMTTLGQTYDDMVFVSLFDEPADDPFVQKPDIYTAIDGLHPTSVGYGIWYQKAKPYFTAALEQQ